MPQKGISLNMPPGILPIHTDEVMIHRRIKVKKTEKGVKKAGHLRIWFIDSLANKVVADIEMDRGLVETFSVLLKKECENLTEELDSDRIPEMPKKEATATTEEMRYIG